MLRFMAVRAVIFDWGGTLTPWDGVDRGALWQQACASHFPADQAGSVAAALLAAENGCWAQCETEHSSATLARIFAAAGVDGARGVHRDVLRAVGAAHVHRPGRGAAAAVASGTVDQGRRAFQHGVAAGAARAGVPPGRGARADRRGGLQQRDPVDQAAPGGVPGGDGRDRRVRPFVVRVRGRPAVRRHLRGRPAGDAHGLHPAQRAAAVRGCRARRGHLPAGGAAWVA